MTEGNAMNINEKIAARRKEVEQERQQALALEVARRKAEHEAQQEVIRLAKLESAAAATTVKKAIEMPGYMVSPKQEPWPDVSIERALINESLERVTKRELFTFFMGIAASLFNIFRGEMGRTIFFGVISLIYIAYVVKKHRDSIISLAKDAAVEDSGA